MKTQRHLSVTDKTERLVTQSNSQVSFTTRGLGDTQIRRAKKQNTCACAFALKEMNYFPSPVQ